LKNPFIFILVLTFGVMLILSSCGPVHEITQSGYLLDKNTVSITDKSKIKGEKTQVSNRDLSGYLKQKPNKKFLGIIRLNTWIYKKASQGKERKYKTWFKEKLGQEPVMLDSSLIAHSQRDMKLYLNNVGYFNSQISSKIHYKKEKAKVEYLVTTNEPYTYRYIDYSIRDDSLARFVLEDRENSLIKTGGIYNSYKLDNERDRITQTLNDSGYYHFAKNFILYEIDSNLNDRQMDLQLIIRNIEYRSEEKPDSIIEQNHRRYMINKVIVNPNFNPRNPVNVKRDTIEFAKIGRKKSDTVGIYYFIRQSSFRLKPKVIAQSLYITPGKIYSLEDVRQSNRHLSKLQITRLVNITFEDMDSLTIRSGEEFGLINSRVFISRAPLNSFAIETDVTNSAGNPGMAGNLIIQNKNIFKGGEVLRFKLSGGAELQTSSSESSSGKFLFFNTLEAGLEISLQIPRFLVPLNQARFPQYFNPRTSIITGFNYQLNPDYTRYITNLSFGYNWEPSDNVNQSFFPFSINSIKIFMDDSSDFAKFIRNTNDLRLKEQYTDHLIMGAAYNYIYSNQNLNKPIDFWYVNYSVETAGNILNLASKAFNASKNEYGKYTIFGIRFAQYIRNSVDGRYYHYLNSDNSVTFRAYGGLGIPYGNSDALPFERGFYAGGANDIRGWLFRRLGPGSYSLDTNNVIDRMGDIKLEANAEYRFTIYKALKGAFFIDMGNVWLLQESDEFPGGKFYFDTFLSQIAMNTGVGFRLDFNFFVFRLDVGVPIRDPAQQSGERWIFTSTWKTDAMWNFGIGYPF